MKVGESLKYPCMWMLTLLILRTNICVAGSSIGQSGIQARKKHHKSQAIKTHKASCVRIFGDVLADAQIFLSVKSVARKGNISTYK